MAIRAMTCGKGHFGADDNRQDEVAAAKIAPIFLVDSDLSALEEKNFKGPSHIHLTIIPHNLLFCSIEKQSHI